jgi:hypothetical protein
MFSSRDVLEELNRKEIKSFCDDRRKNLVELYLLCPGIGPALP